MKNDSKRLEAHSYVLESILAATVEFSLFFIAIRISLDFAEKRRTFHLYYVTTSYIRFSMQ